MVRTARSRAAAPAAAGLVVGMSLLFMAMPFANPAGASALTQAKGHLLGLSAMPKGWKTEKGTGGSGGSSAFPGASQLASCVGAPAQLITANPPEINSPYYENKGGTLEVQDTVTVFPSAKKAKAEYAVVSNTHTPTCLSSIVNGPAFKSQLATASGKDATIGTITVAKLGTANFAPGVTSVQLSIPITYQGLTITARLTEVFFVKGDLGQQITFNAYDTTFPASLSRRLTALATSRL
jgi:hypothetical protein